MTLASSVLWKTGRLNISLCLLMLLLAALEPHASELLRYDRYAIDAGEWWRLCTAHLVHLSWTHTLLNLSGLALTTLIFQTELSTRDDSIALAVCICGTTFGIHLFSPQLIWYVGFSGVLHGYLIYHLIKGNSGSPLPSLIAVTAVFAKVLWEQSPWGDTARTAQLIGGAVAIDSHLYGAISGLLMGWIARACFGQAPPKRS
jgi:rhomboid family GlyGly-CTERM serine protease